MAMIKGTNGRSIETEAKAISYICGYSPAQILMNNHNYNYTLEEYKSLCSKNKHILDCIDLQLSMCRLYERSFQRLGAQNYTDLSRSGLQGDYDRLQSAFNSSLKKAKDSVMNLCIKEGDIYYTDVYELLLKKRENLVKKIKSGKGTHTSEWQLQEYDLLINNYNSVSWRKYPLF